jgi:hypothetical protein
MARKSSSSASIKGVVTMDASKKTQALFRVIIYLLGFDAWQENKIIKKLFNPDRYGRMLHPDLRARVYDVLLSGQFTPTHREGLQKFGL